MVEELESDGVVYSTSGEVVKGVDTIVYPFILFFPLSATFPRKGPDFEASLTTQTTRVYERVKGDSYKGVGRQ
jgi:hypothetical protein